MTLEPAARASPDVSALYSHALCGLAAPIPGSIDLNKVPPSVSDGFDNEVRSNKRDDEQEA